MISMTKYDGSFAASRWLCILKEKLIGQLSPGTWLEQADTWHEGCAASWAERTSEVVRILVVDNIAAMTVEDKNSFIQLLIQEFPDDSCNVITDEKVSAKLSNLPWKKDENLYTYYQHTETLLKRIHGRDQVTNSGRVIVTLSPVKQQLLKDTIMKFIPGIRNLDL